MRVLLDTHTFLWFAQDSDRLSARCRAVIADADNKILVSWGSLWEIAIKMNLGKLTLSGSYYEVVEKPFADGSFELLPLNFRVLQTLATLPQHHRDPFDRLLAAHCLADNLTLLGADVAFDAYGVKRVW